MLFERLSKILDLREHRNLAMPRCGLLSLSFSYLSSFGGGNGHAGLFYNAFPTGSSRKKSGNTGCCLRSRYEVPSANESPRTALWGMIGHSTQENPIISNAKNPSKYKRIRRESVGIHIVMLEGKILTYFRNEGHI